MVTGSDVLWQSVTVFYGEKVRAKIIRELEEKYHELHEPLMEPNPPIPRASKLQTAGDQGLPFNTFLMEVPYVCCLLSLLSSS